MKRETFKTLCNAYMSFESDYEIFSEIIEIDYITSKMATVLDAILHSEYDSNGVDNVWWYMCERTLLNSNLKAWDSNGVEIMYDLDSLYDFIEMKNKKEAPYVIDISRYGQACEDMSNYIKLELEFSKIGVDFSKFGIHYKNIFGILKDYVK